MNAKTQITKATKQTAIEKLCSILKSLANRSPQRLNEITASTGLNRVTAFRILEELVAEGMIEKKGSPPRYDFGPELIAIAAATSRSTDIRTLARPSLIRLADQTGDTIVLHVRSHWESLCIDQVVGDFPIRANLLNVGSRRPLGVGAGSMALLAGLQKTEQTTLLDITCANLDSFPNFDRDLLLNFIEEYRTQGFVNMCDVIVDKMGAIAMPIFDRYNHVMASISIAALSERIIQRETELVKALQKETKIIAKLIHA